jgi:hypothetical protein
MSKESEEYRRHMLRHLEQKFRQSKPAEVLEAERVIAKYRIEQEQAIPQLERLQKPLPEPDLCPQCYYRDGKTNTLIAAVHSDPARYDIMKCRLCGYYEERPVR